MQIDKQNLGVGFSSNDHKYFSLSNPEKEYVSVTTLIHSFSHPFDEEFWASYKALEKILSQSDFLNVRKELLDKKKIPSILIEEIGKEKFEKAKEEVFLSWTKENDDSLSRGTDIHETLEKNFISKKKDILLDKYGIGGKFSLMEEFGTIGAEGVFPEYLVYNDSIVPIAGQIDLLVQKDDMFSIIDWKGLPLDTKILTTEGFKTMGTIKEGDIVYDKDGNETKVLHLSDIHHNPCFKIKFRNGITIVCDKDHRWLVKKFIYQDKSKINETELVLTTESMFNELLGSHLTRFEIPAAVEPKTPYHTLYHHITRGIEKIEPYDTVPTKCIEVDSPTSTYLCTEYLIVTHNTNKEIKKRSYYDKVLHKSEKLLFPLSDLDDCNYNIYNLQLSTYAWMIKQNYPHLQLKELRLVHFPHDGNMKVYKMDYLGDQVERMLLFYKKQSIIKRHREESKFKVEEFFSKG